MFINENFFKDIELTDDDIVANDNNDTDKSLPNLYDYYNQHYSETIYISVYEKDSSSVFAVKKLSKNIEYILDAFNIEHSEINVFEYNDYMNKDNMQKDVIKGQTVYRINDHIGLQNTSKLFFIATYVNYNHMTIKTTLKLFKTISSLFRLEDKYGKLAVYINNLSLYKRILLPEHLKAVDYDYISEYKALSITITQDYYINMDDPRFNKRWKPKIIKYFKPYLK